MHPKSIKYAYQQLHAGFKSVVKELLAKLCSLGYADTTVSFYEQGCLHPCDLSAGRRASRDPRWPFRSSLRFYRYRYSCDATSSRAQRFCHRPVSTLPDVPERDVRSRTTGVPRRIAHRVPLGHWAHDLRPSASRGLLNSEYFQLSSTSAAVPRSPRQRVST